MALLPRDEQAEITIDIPIDQVPPWLGEIFMSGNGEAWPLATLRIDRARFAEPVTVTSDVGGGMRLKATLYAKGVGFSASE